MTFTIYSLFPQLIALYAQDALLGRAIDRGLLSLQLRDLRPFAGNRSGRVDDAPYGGGAGMVIRVDVIAAAVAEVGAEQPPPDEIILLSPAGEVLTQELVEAFAGREHLCLIAGRYEGFDARSEDLVTREVSVGDFVLMGGELPALCLLESVARLLPGVLGDAESHRQDSFSSGLLDYPEYTRPADFRGETVPEVLRSGHHGEVARWRRQQALLRTFLRRPDLLEKVALSDDERAFIERLRGE